PSTSSTREGRFVRRGMCLAAAAGLLALSACGPDQTQDPDEGDGAPPEGDGTPAATAQVQDADGTELGTAEFTEVDDGMEVRVDLSELEPGHHGLHVHGIGVCEPDSTDPDDPSETGDFLSAGGHLGGDASEHPDHPGDLPSLLVNEDGTAEMTFVSDRLTAQDLLDEDGTALIVHSDPDTFANIPERYAPDGAAEHSTGAGDAGDRFACGVREPADACAQLSHRVSGTSGGARGAGEHTGGAAGSGARDARGPRAGFVSDATGWGARRSAAGPCRCRISVHRAARGRDGGPAEIAAHRQESPGTAGRRSDRPGRDRSPPPPRSVRRWSGPRRSRP